jgi:hypothetical protein
MTKIPAVHQQIAIKCKPFDKNIPPYCRHKPEQVLESADMILYWDMSIITDTTANFNRPDTVLIDTSIENKAALVTDIADPFTHNLSNIEAEEIMKYENLALQLKNIRKLYNVSVYPLFYLSGGSGHRKLSSISRKCVGLTKHILRVG